MVLSLVEQCLDTRLREAPGARVERLLLAPDDRLGVGILVQVLAELLPRERVELLDARESNIVYLVVGAVLVQGGVNLARAENDTVYLLRCLYSARLVLWISDQRTEASIRAREVLDARSGDRMAEKRLGEEDDQG